MAITPKCEFQIRIVMHLNDMRYRSPQAAPGFVARMPKFRNRLFKASVGKRFPAARWRLALVYLLEDRVLFSGDSLA
jgi:hypothetical protein